MHNRSTPRPNANPETSSGSYPTARNTFGSTIPAPPNSIQFPSKYEALQTIGAPRIRVLVTDIRSNVRDRFVALTEWHYSSAGGDCLGHSRTRHFLELVNGRFSVRMVEFDRIRNPHVEEWLAGADPEAAVPARVLH